MESQPHNYYISDKWILDSVYGYTKQTITFENNIGKQVTKKSALTNTQPYDSSIWHYDETKNMNPASSQNMFQFIDSEYTFYRAIANQYKDYFNICNDMHLHHPLNIWTPYNMSKICLEIQFTETSLKEIGKSINITFQTPVELTNTYPQPEDNSFSHKEIKRLNLHNIHFTVFLSGKEKDAAIASISVLAMPSEFENLGNVILEGLVRKIPCIATYGSPWEELNTYHCGWWVRYSPNAITSAIREAMNTPKEELKAMGERGKALMEKNYSIEAVTYKMKLLYEWILGQNEKPEFVYE